VRSSEYNPTLIMGRPFPLFTAGPYRGGSVEVSSSSPIDRTYGNASFALRECNLGNTTFGGWGDASRVSAQGASHFKRIGLGNPQAELWSRWRSECQVINDMGRCQRYFGNACCLLGRFAGRSVTIHWTETKGASSCLASQPVRISKRLQLLWDERFEKGEREVTILAILLCFRGHGRGKWLIAC
jgi:hypothetical protein